MDTNKAVQKLTPVDMAIKIGVSLAKQSTAVEKASLLDAHNRICSGKMAAHYPLPNFNNSAMDGYAVNTAAISGDGPFTLKISGTIAAGDLADEATVRPATDAIRILTGAQVPAAYDAVIMQEKCVVKNGCVSFDECPPLGNNIRFAGTDCQIGESIIEPSTLIKSHHISLLAAQGIAEVPVFKKVKVAIFATGSELRQPGEKLKNGQIYNSNLYTITMQLAHQFIEIINLGTIPDQPELLKDVLINACEKADVVISTGGVSVGDEDHMPRLVNEIGGTLHVMKVAIKPGKPVTVGTVCTTIYVGLPGNPVAAFINQVLIARPIIEKIAGIVNPSTNLVAVQAGFTRISNINRQEYILARISGSANSGIPIVEILPKSGSASLLPLSRSDGFVVIQPGLVEIKPGDPVQFLPHS